MRNKLLSITRGSIPYIKELKPYAGSVTACILMQQLDYWFNAHGDRFYKFKEPCDNEFYKKGDSWCEELGFTAEEFDTAFSKIGIKYKSKTEFMKAKDKFQGKFYAAYTDKTQYLTYYFRNHELVDTILDEMSLNTSNDAPIHVNRHSRFTGTDIPGLREPTFPVPIYRTEITTETTTERKALSKKVSPEKKINTLLPEDIKLSEEWKTYMLEKGIHPTQVDRVWDQFCEHHWSRGDKMVNWKAALGKWCTNCKEYSPWAFEVDPKFVPSPEEIVPPEFDDSPRGKFMRALYERSPIVFNSWFKDMGGLWIEGNILYVEVNSSFARDTINQKFFNEMLFAANAIVPNIENARAVVE